MKNLLTYLLWVFPCYAFAQSVDLESFGKPPALKITGGLSANTVFYESNLQNSRAPFTYFLQGNLNVSCYNFSVPVSYSYSNQGDQLGYQLPFNLNRLSLHPKYQWMTAHIGDVNMTFSPYTLNGHQFTGAGVDIATKRGFSLSALYGRFLKPTEADKNAQTLPSYKRMGYGFKTTFEKERFGIGLTSFYAVDRENSVMIDPDETGVLPKENLVLGLNGDISLTNDLKLNAEYAITAITQDTRALQADNGKNGLLGAILTNRASTEYYHAYKLGLHYRYQQASLGVGYERIDPGYETLGAYFFNNDFENITVNVAHRFFGNTLNLGFNVGYQKDDLNDQKSHPSKRFVGAVNASLQASEKLNIVGSYSNFSTFTNVRANQFDNINDDNLLDNVLDTLNYRQVSQNANLNINYVLSDKKIWQQQLNLNYNVSDIANEQGGVVRIGDASTFHNAGLVYAIGFPKRNLNIVPAVNGTYNTIGREDATTWGPTVSIRKGYLENRLNVVCSTSYNTTSNAVGETEITNIRMRFSYVLWQKHHFNLHMVQLFKNGPTAPKLTEFTGTFGYNYAFDLLRKRDRTKKQRPPKAKGAKEATIKINYRQYRFEGTPTEVTKAILGITATPDFGVIPSDKKLELRGLEENLTKAIDKKEQLYRENAITYLKSLDAFKTFKRQYHRLITMAYDKLIREGEEADGRLEKEFVQLNGENNDPDIKKTPEFLNTLVLVNKRYDAHRKMLRGLKTWNILKDSKSARLKAFKNENINKIYTMYFENRSEDDIITFLEYRLADVYHLQTKDSSSSSFESP